MGTTVVIGAGAAGLAAAYTLERAGADCVVLEKREFSGGRIYGKVVEGCTLDVGAQFFFTRYRETYDIMDKLGIAGDLVRYKPFVGLLRDDNVYVVSQDIKQAFLHPGMMLRAGRMLSSMGKLRAVKFGLKLAALGKKLDFDDPLKAIELDNVSFADYTRANFGDEILEYIAQPVASTLSLGQPEEISAAYGMALTWYIAPGLATLRKGIGQLAEALTEEIKDVRLGTEATRIVMEGGKVKGVEVSDVNGKEVIEADHVVCATLAPEAAGLLGDGLDPTLAGTLKDVKYSACAHVMMGVEGRPLDMLYAIATPRREGLCFSGITENAIKAPGYAPAGKGIIHAYTFGEYGRELLTMDDAAVRDRVLGDIQRVVPTFPDEPVFTEIFRWPEAVCLTGPGHITAVQRMKVGLRDYQGLHLAGEYLGMGSVEAAIHTGVKAAEKVLRVS
ncbi:MAG: FAD-dependent oxidoreductase [Actinobacteria bacterium]|nr:FAD-dependent oxidoreductase [Actinomycetota bacterium]MBU1944148.1 FAD-dependent oxidoreductase [Actinomycetota bacterium]MBU2687467.1 FAD-dependent oxidoreductase [Actinomycetota bacterium]